MATTRIKQQIRLSIIFLIVGLFISSTTYAKNQSLTSNSAKQQLEQLVKKHSGQVIYLDFWASWCGPCRKSFPWMNEMQEKYQQQGFKVIAINLDAEYELAEQFLTNNPANFEIVYDPEGEIAKHFAIQGMPTSILIDASGKVSFQHTGFFDGKSKQYQQEIEQLIAD